MDGNFGNVKKNFNSHDHGGCLEEVMQRSGKNNDQNEWKTRFKIEDTIDNWATYFSENFSQITNFQQYHSFRFTKGELWARENHEGEYKKIHIFKKKKPLPETMGGFNDLLLSCGKTTISEKLYETIDDIIAHFKFCTKCTNFWKTLKNDYETNLNRLITEKEELSLDTQGRISNNVRILDPDYIYEEEIDLLCEEEPNPKKRKK